MADDTVIEEINNVTIIETEAAPVVLIQEAEPEVHIIESIEVGPPGSPGDDGIPGDDGREILLQKSATHIQWKYEDEEEWTNLVALADITGVDGAPGDDGREIELQVTASYIQWRYVDGEWINLIALADITGVKGDTGASIISAEIDEYDIVFTKDNDETVRLENAVNTLKGEPGEKGDKGEDADPFLTDHNNLANKQGGHEADEYDEYDTDQYNHLTDDELYFVQHPGDWRGDLG